MDVDDFHSEWFQNPQWWFSPTPDRIDIYLTSKYGHLLVCDKTSNATEFQKVLIHDQLARHVYRHQPVKIAEHLKIALEILEPPNALYRVLPTLSEAEKVFFMLPIRHSGDYNNIKKVLGYSFVFLATAPSESARNLLKRFIKAACKDLIKYQPPPSAVSMSRLPISFSQFKAILEEVPSDPPQRMVQIKIKLNVAVPFIPVISLSGGVDSMVLSYLLRTRYPNLPIKAIMINYMNRPECNMEVAFVSMWCAKMSIDLHVHHIPEMNRNLCIIENMRETYESYTKQVRYQAYRSFGSDATIFLGHNKDDVMENIFTNVMDKHQYSNLAGMSEEDHIEGITFHRPLLPIRKSLIFAFAHYHKIPYLKNTTPSWSRRAKMRDMFTRYSTLISESGMDYLNSALRFYTSYLSSSLCAKKTQSFPVKYLSTDEIYWKTYFEVMKCRVSSKSIKSFLDRLVKWLDSKKSKSQTFVLSSQVSLVISKTIDSSIPMVIISLV
jgi:tRNA(Ile)-lysidine synthetase-like protein